MNETENRRRNLLEYTRNLYQEKMITPAVHPRYKCSYYQLYSDNNRGTKGTFTIRCLICGLILVCYVTFNDWNYKGHEINNVQVQNIIMRDYLVRLF